MISQHFSYLCLFQEFLLKAKNEFDKLKAFANELDGLKKIEKWDGAYSIEFEFGWNKTKVLADVRDKMTQAEAEFPSGAKQYSVNEINFSEFPIAIVLIGMLAYPNTFKIGKRNTENN